MAKGISNTSRTLKYLKEEGHICDVVERWVRNPAMPAGGFRRDFLNIIDIISLHDKTIFGVQSCGQAFAEHDRTILSSAASVKWLECGGQLVLIAWRKVKLKRGGKALRWSPRIKNYTLKDF